MVDRADMIEICQPFTITASISNHYDKSAMHKKIYTIRGGVGKTMNYTRNLRFKDYDHVAHVAKTDQFVRFIYECTHLCPLLFDIAYENAGVAIPFCVDYNKYIAKCGGNTLFFDYGEIVDFKNFMEEKFDLIALRKAQKKLREGK